TGICTCGGVAVRDRGGHRGVADDPCPAAIANALAFAAPSVLRQPDFDLDVGIARRLRREREATKRRQRLIRIGRRGGWRATGPAGTASAAFRCDTVWFRGCPDARS